MKAFEKTRQKTQIVLWLVLLLNVCFWYGARDILPKWPGVPPAPSEKSAETGALGDKQFAYRIWALSLQNFGDTGGQSTSLKDYDYTKLDPWFGLLRKMDPNSDHISLILAYYFGAVRERPESTKIVVKHLSEMGDTNKGDKWRWLAQAAFLAKHQLNDLPYALELAERLAKLEPEGGKLPLWARQMPMILHADMGEKEMAIALIEGLLFGDNNIHPNEINFMLSFLEDRLGVNVAERYGLSYK